MNKFINSIILNKEEMVILNEVCPVIGRLLDLEPRLKEFMECNDGTRSNISETVEKMVRTYYSCIKAIQAVGEGFDVDIKIMPKEKQLLFSVGGKNFY